MSRVLTFFTVLTAASLFQYDRTVNQVKNHIAAEATKHSRAPDSQKLQTAAAICAKYRPAPISATAGHSPTTATTNSPSTTAAAAAAHTQAPSLAQEYCEQLFLQNYRAFMLNARVSSEAPTSVNPTVTTLMFVKAALVRAGIVESDDDGDDDDDDDL